MQRAFDSYPELANKERDFLTSQLVNITKQQAAKDFAQLSQNKLPFPVLVIGGEKANGDVLARQLKLVASNVTVVILKDTGHWVLEERPKETTDALLKFL